jgi:hypothetical protein
LPDGKRGHHSERGLEMRVATALDDGKHDVFSPAFIAVD